MIYGNKVSITWW